MSDREHHCPFLNRADHRCSTFFSIERLQHAFEHCFDAYKSCAVYRELLIERQARRGQLPDAAAAFVWTTACGARESDVTTTRFVQVRLPSVAASASGSAAAGAAVATR
jgi:hypothetical protein